MLEAMTKGLTVRGVLQGDSTPGAHDPPPLGPAPARRCCPFDRLITHYRLDEINRAAADTETGDVVKPVLLMPDREPSRASLRPPDARADGSAWDGGQRSGSGSSTSRTTPSSSAQAPRNCRSVLRVAPNSWNSPIVMPSAS